MPDHELADMQKASAEMGYLFTNKCFFIVNAIEWLSAKGSIMVQGSPSDGYTIVSAFLDYENDFIATGDTLAEALCGAVFAVPTLTRSEG